MIFRVKTKFLFLFFFILSFISFISSGIPCTLVKWADNGIAVLIGRTLDWTEDMKTNLWVFPRGIQRSGLVHENPLQWTSKYGSLVATVYDVAVAEGMNEKGLSAHLLWLTESDYGERDPNLPGLSISLWAQYFLDNFSTVNEAVDYFEKNPFQPVTAKFGPKKMIATVHLAIEDSTGDTAIIEYIKGKPKIYHGKEYKVMTNSPPYEEQIENLKQYRGFGGHKMLPGSGQAADRYVRAAYYLMHLSESNNLRQAIAGVLSVIRNASQPFGLIDEKTRVSAPYVSPTYWRSVSDLTHKVYYFESTLSPFLIWVKLKELNFQKGNSVLKLNLTHHPDWAGDVSKKFIPTKGFEFAKPQSY